MNQISDYLTVGSLISGFGVAVLMFRLQREIIVQETPETDEQRKMRRRKQGGETSSADGPSEEPPNINVQGMPDTEVQRAELLRARDGKISSGDERSREPRGEPSRIACADLLVIVAITISLLFAVFPLVFFDNPRPLAIKLAAAACSSAVILLAGYPFAILDHYGIFPWAERASIINRGAYKWGRGEPIEEQLVLGCLGLGLIIFVSVLIR